MPVNREKFENWIPRKFLATQCVLNGLTSCLVSQRAQCKCLLLTESNSYTPTFMSFSSSQYGVVLHHSLPKVSVQSLLQKQHVRQSIVQKNESWAIIFPTKNLTGFDSILLRTKFHHVCITAFGNYPEQGDRCTTEKPDQAAQKNFPVSQWYTAPHIQ